MGEIVESYLSRLREIRSSGQAVDETSYYGALETLLNDVGKTLKPRVRCVLTLRNRGAGLPDGGLFTPDQFQKGTSAEPMPGQLPARGVVEAKGAGEDARAVAGGEQVARYCQWYGQVLVTNYREFLLVGQDTGGYPQTPAGRPVELESYSLASGEAAFWAAAAHPRRTAALHGEPLVEFLKRAMLHPAPLSAPQELAWFLASYARDARARIEAVDLPSLAAVRAALEEALGIEFRGSRGEHFFRSTLVQTLFYGIFAAWVLWCRTATLGDTPRPPRKGTATLGDAPRPPGAATLAGRRFEWRMAAYHLRVPVLRKLFYEVAEPGQLDTLGLSEVLDWAGAALHRVDRDAFFARFEEERAVQYFYEPFLEAYDPQLRKELGVWYTPPEIVHYMVERVDAVLRGELGIEEGLADPRVYVLDPCCGTGAYLVEVLRRIETTLKERGGDALLAEDLKRAAMERVFGFEIMPAPFVVAHLQLGLQLQRLGTPLSDRKGERVAVYLTNALTGWEPPTGAKRRLPFLELEEERDAAERVKQQVPILVILGNPPYNGFAGMAVSEERDLTNAYRTAKRAPAPQGQGLNDLYVRFFRMAERRIAEQTGRGVVCFISNYSWLDGLSFTGMRERYLEAFDRIWIDNLHGDRIISEYTPDGRTSETVMAMEGRSPGIKVGTAISLLVARESPARADRADLFYRDMDQARAAERRAALVASLAASEMDRSYVLLEPEPAVGFPFKPRAMDQAYLSWPLLPQLFPVSFAGVKTSRDDVVVDIDRERLVERMGRYFDPNLSEEEVRQLVPGAMESTSGFDARATRAYLCRRGFLPERVVRYCYRPFDLRWLYWEPETKLLDRNRAEYFPHLFPGNLWMVSQQKPRREWSKPQIVRAAGCLDLMDRSASLVPLFLRLPTAANTLFSSEQWGPDSDASNRQRPNLTEVAAAYLARSGCSDSPETLFYHSLAILHGSAYREENAGALRQDWPRVPLPQDRELLLASAALGRQLASLLDPEAGVSGVTSGTPRPELGLLGRIARRDGGQLRSDRDLEVTAGWGFAGQGGIAMPGQGKLAARGYTSAEAAALEEGARALGLAFADLPRLLGEETLDVYLNEVAYWSNVPTRVWRYTLGGYQVLKKWLSYRERELLGRGLRPEEARHFTAVVRRIAALLLMEPQLDANYRAVKGDGYPWGR